MKLGQNRYEFDDVYASIADKCHVRKGLVTFIERIAGRG